MVKMSEEAITMPRRKKTGIFRLLEIAGERSWLLILSGVLSALSALFMLVPYAAVYFILADILRSGLDPARINGAMMERAAYAALIGAGVGMALLYASAMASHIAAFRILYGLRVRLAEHLGKLHLGYLSQTSTGAVKKTVEQNVERIEAFIAHQIPDLISVLATVVIMFVAMFWMNVWMAVACLGGLVISFSLQGSMMVGRKSKGFITAYHDALENINASSVQYVRGMPAVKVFGQTVHSFRRFAADMRAYRDMAMGFSDTFQNGFLAFKTALASILVFILPVALLLLRGEPESMALALVILFFIVMAPAAAAPAYKLMYLASTVRDISEGVTRIDAVFAEPPTPEPGEPQMPDGATIEFDNVSFSYQGGNASTLEEALREVSFRAAPGTVTALVGSSGSGKSTAAHLIPRFYDVSEGAIRVGGVDVRQIPTPALMDTVAFVFQETFLFSDTVLENIRVGRPEAGRDEVEAAARAAQCHEFITQLPMGYETRVGEGGQHLSGGEEQRITVARAILKNAPILVLDEATSFADPENEHLMQRALEELMRDKTVIVIAHRLSTIRDADNIVVLDEGRAAESGTHDELLAGGGLYHRMWTAYSDTMDWNLGGSEVPA
jgi:ATP-binding cassette subfamily B protein